MAKSKRKAGRPRMYKKVSTGGSDTAREQGKRTYMVYFTTEEKARLEQAARQRHLYMKYYIANAAVAKAMRTIAAGIEAVAYLGKMTTDVPRGYRSPHIVTSGLSITIDAETVALIQRAAEASGMYLNRFVAEATLEQIQKDLEGASDGEAEKTERRITV